MKKRKLNKKAYIVFAFILIVIIAVIIVFLLNRKESKNEFLGYWTIDGYTNYEFTTDTNGKMDLAVGEFPFNYEVKEDTICIDFENEKSIDRCYEYEFKEGTLYLSYDNGKELKLNKVNKVEN